MRDTPEKHRTKCADYAHRLIPLIRTRAQELGYAIGVHGSLAHDIDLIAAPWSGEAVPAHELAEAIARVAADEVGIAFISPHEDDNFHRCGCPNMKPHGRLSWAFHLGGGPYIDLSIMPRAPMAFHDVYEVVSFTADPANRISRSLFQKGDTA